MPQGQIKESNTRVCITIPKNLKLEADKIANADGRSLAGWIRKLVIDAVNEHNKSDNARKRHANRSVFGNLRLSLQHYRIRRLHRLFWRNRYRKRFLLYERLEGAFDTYA